MVGLLDTKYMEKPKMLPEDWMNIRRGAQADLVLKISLGMELYSILLLAYVRHPTFAYGNPFDFLDFSHT